jgi:hypothetical protein
MKHWITGVFVFLLLNLYGQVAEKNQDKWLESIGFYADVMVNADKASHRLKAYEQFSTSLDSLLALPGSFAISLDSIPWISILKADSFRIASWQLRISDEEYKYGGFIQDRDQIIPLKDTRPWMNGSLRNYYTAGSWYGALYYKLIPYDANRYILFGFNAENSILNTKVADILDLTGTDVRFGAPVFTGKDDPQTRLMLTYADVSSVQLEYDPELNAIVHDHVINLEGVGRGGETLPVSDGSFEGWIYNNGIWTYQEKVYDEIVEKPPMTDERKERKEDKDILGRPKK